MAASKCSSSREIYEGTLGSKNRLVQWMACGLPVVYNRIGDLGDYLADDDLGLTFDLGDAAALADRLVWAARHRDELGAMAARAREKCRRDFSFVATTEALRDWAAAPTHAPDFASDVLRSPYDFEEIPAPEPPAADPLRRPRGWRRRLRAGLKRWLAP
jgi:hypothetical protein